jgi:hypothetical protein
VAIGLEEKAEPIVLPFRGIDRLTALKVLQCLLIFTEMPVYLAARPN